MRTVITALAASLPFLVDLTSACFLLRHVIIPFPIGFLLSIDNKKPIGNGIITCLNMRQAIARKKKGREAAQAVISVLSQ